MMRLFIRLLAAMLLAGTLAYATGASGQSSPVVVETQSRKVHGGAGTFNLVLGGGTPSDAAPTVVATVPTNNATGVASAANVTIQFSEPVTVSGNWFQIACTSGMRTPANTTVTGDLSATSGTTFTLDPNANFAFGDVCTATLFASAISDNDTLDPPDHPVADFNFAFTVSAGNGAPIVRNDSAATQPGAAVQFNVLANDSDPDLDALVVSSSGQGANGSVVCLANGNCTYTPKAGFAGIDTFAYTVGDGHGGQASGSVVVTVLPSDPTLVASPLDLTVATNVDQIAAFLYSGANPVQTGVAPGTIQATRASILRGSVLKRDGTPLPGAIVTILGNSQFGQTLSRANGAYDMAVNGARLMTLNYAAAGFLPAQRQVQVPWQGFVNVPDVALVPLDTPVTTITANAGAMQMHQGSLVTDADGSRRATLLFPSGTTATMVLPDASTQPLATLNVRATEYTVGPNGPRAMPGDLPAASAYTYAVELSVDQALAAGATTVTFNQPVIVYVENFLGFAVGMVVPVGTYDRVAGRWVPEPNGRVVKIVGISGGAADLDVTGDGIADTGTALTDLGITLAELQQLATLYAPGQSLWRVPKTHFTSEDCNWPWVPADDAKTPPEAGADVTPNLPETDVCEVEGSIIECQNQVLGQRIPIVGTPYTLNYRSDRVPGKLDVLDIAVSGATVPASLAGIDVRVDVGGQQQAAQFPPEANQNWSVYGNHTDAYGRQVQGAQPFRVTISYAYPGHYVDPGDLSPILRWFGRPGIGIQSIGVRGTGNVAVAHTYTGTLGEGIHDARPFGLGGWMLDVHHFYDFAGKTLYSGDGARTRAVALGRVITTIGGTGVAGVTGNNVSALLATVDPNGGMGIGPDGTIYFCNFSTAVSNSSLLRRIGPGGVISTVAGSATQDAFNGDNILAINAHLTCLDVVVGPDFSVYVVDLVNRRVRRVRPNNTITTVAGDGTNALGADDVPATSTSIVPNAIALGPEGNLYVAENIGSVTGGATLSRIRRVAPDGLISTVLTCATSSCGTTGMVTGPDGSLYYVDRGNFAQPGDRIKRLRPDGRTMVIAGSGTCQFGVDGIANGTPALQANLCVASVHAVDGRGTVYISDTNSPQFAAVTTDGLITVLGGINGGTLADGALARDAKLDTVSMRIGHDGALYLSTRGSFPQNARIRRITDPLPGYLNTGFTVASRDGHDIYTFDAQGRHLNTRHQLTGTILRAFGYDAAGRLSTVTELTGGTDNVTTIQHDASGNPTKIIGPYGQQSLLATDANGFLSAVTNPANETVQLTSSANGSLLAVTDPRGKVSVYGFDAQGRLISDADSLGGAQALVRTTATNQYQVSRTTGLSRTSTLKVEDLPGDLHRVTNTAADGTRSITEETRSAGFMVSTSANGSVATVVVDADPRFGMQAPVAKSLTYALPSGLTLKSSQVRTATLSVPSDLLSLTSLTDTATINGRSGTRVFTAATSTLTTTTPMGRTSSLVLDSLGRPTASQVSGIGTMTFTYDARGRIATVAQASGAEVRSASFTYGADGNLQTMTDPLGRKAQWSYDPAGRLATKTFPDGRVATYQYDAAGNVLSVAPPGRPAHTFAYSDRGELVQVTPPAVPGTGATAFGYDLDADLANVARPDGRSVALGYDGGGRLATRAMKTGAVVTATDAVTYDGAGRIATVTSGNGEITTYTYDGPLLTGETWTGPVGGSVTQTFDSTFRTSSESVNGGGTVTFLYDNDDLLIGAGPLTIARDAQNGLPTATTLGTVGTGIAFDGFVQASAYGASAGATSVFSNTYLRDAGGRVTQKSETIGGVTDVYSYKYDLAGRLTGVSKNSVSVESYSYDANGNRVSATVAGSNQSATYDAQDRLVQYGPALFAYNAAGDLATKTIGAQTTTYSYDQLGNLVAVSPAGGSAVTYVVDGNNRRVGKRVSGTLVKGFLYSDAARPIAELDGTGALVSRFVYAGHHVPAYMTRQGTTYRFVTDQVGSVRLVVDTATGTIAQRLDYDAFGNVVSDTNPNFQPFGFAGGLYDPDTGLVHFSRRDYDSTTGRWTTKDALGFYGGDSNLYLYAGGDPVNAYDPRGDATLDAGSFPAGTDEQHLLAKVRLALTALSGAGKKDTWSRTPRGPRSEKLKMERDFLGDGYEDIWKNSTIRYDPNCSGATGNRNGSGGADIVLGPWFLRKKFLSRNGSYELEKIILHEYLHNALDEPFQFHGNPDRNNLQHGFIDQILQFNLSFKGSPNPGAP